LSILRTARLENNLSGPEVSRITGISTTNLYRYENRNRKLPIQIAKKLGELYKMRWERFYDDAERLDDE